MGHRRTRTQQGPTRGLAAILASISIALTGCGDLNSETPKQAGSIGQESPHAEAAHAPPAATGPELPEGLASDHPILSPNAKIDTYLTLLEEVQRGRTPGDGQGSARLVRAVSVTPPLVTPPLKDRIDPDLATVPTESSNSPSRATSESIVPAKLTAGSSARFEILFEVGAQGIAEGGILFVQPDPFWDWSPAQTRSEKVPGYTTAQPLADDVELVPDSQWASFTVRGRGLRAGEKVEIVYGAGPSGAQVDRYADRAAEILIGVDADADGFRAWIDDSPRVAIHARPARQIVAFGPAVVRPGERFSIRLSAVDGLGNHAQWPEFEAAQDALTFSPEAQPSFGLSLAPPPSSAPVPNGTKNESATRPTVVFPRPATRTAPIDVEVQAPDRPGTLRYVVQGHGALANFATEVHPIVVREGGARLYWADLHGHSGLSDGSGTASDYFTYARDVARLDAIALTDHDHWGIRPLDRSPEIALEISNQTAAFHAPGRFVTIPGYEWTNWLHGHRHVLYFGDNSTLGDGPQGEPATNPIFSSMDFETDRPDELWAALRGRPALTFAHHTAGEPVATNWFYRPDPVLEPVVEISSIHGVSEAADVPSSVEGGLPGYFVRDTLMRGDRLGFIGSGDSHDGHPGLANLAASGGRGGLAGIFAEDLSRSALLKSLRRRHTFATNGHRPFLEVDISDTPMGGSLESAPDDGIDATARGDAMLRVFYEGTAAVERVDLIRSGAIASIPIEGQLQIDFERQIPALAPGEFHYVRVIQKDGGIAWSSPIYGATTD